MLVIYSVAALIRMGNWVQNDTYRSAGDAAFGSMLEITFMYLMVLPFVYLSNFYFHAPFLLVFAFCYVDEPIRYIIMQRHLYSGKWFARCRCRDLPHLENSARHMESDFD